MPSIESRPPGERLRRLEDHEKNRHLDLCLVVCDPDGEEIYRVGGKWDRYANRGRGAYVGDAETGRVIKLRPSQVEAARWFAAWLENRRSWLAKRPGVKRPDHVLFLGGPRRGGKTVDAVLFVMSLCLEVPGAVTYIVSATIELREEIERLFAGDPTGSWKGLPAHWYEYFKTPQFKYYFANGSTCRNVSGAIPARMKRGKAHAVLINEAQEQAASVATYSVPSVIDTNGLAIFAANPPDKPKGQWINGFREKLRGIDEEGRPLCAEVEGQYFAVDPALNDTIDQGLRGAVAVTLAAIDEDAAKRDATGLWLPVGDLAYPKFIARPTDRGGMVGPPPDTLKDITREALRRARAPYNYDYVIGGDFQAAWAMVAAVFRVFERPTDRKQIYWLVDEVVVEGDEIDLSDDVIEKGYSPDNAIWIPDATGEMQDGKHSKRNTSFGKLQKQGWKVIPPNEKVSEGAKNAVNPRVYKRLGMMFKLMQEERFFVAPHCKIMVEALSKCPLHKGRYGGMVPYGDFSHPTDACGYPLWKLEPEIKKLPGRPLRLTDIAALPVGRTNR